MNIRVGIALVVGMAAGASAVSADERAWDVSVGGSWTDYDELDDAAVGLTLSLSRRLSESVAVDAQVGFEPSDLGEPGFSASRTEGFVGVRGGPRLGRHQVYAAVRPGFVRFAEASEPIACIAIFPPPLVCALSAGDTVLGLQLMGGAELVPSPRSLVRIEAGTLLVRYRGPAFARDGSTFEDSRWSQNLRVALSVGLRF